MMPMKADCISYLDPKPSLRVTQATGLKSKSKDKMGNKEQRGHKGHRATQARQGRRGIKVQ